LKHCEDAVVADLDAERFAARRWCARLSSAFGNGAACVCPRIGDCGHSFGRGQSNPSTLFEPRSQGIGVIASIRLKSPHRPGLPNLEDAFQAGSIRRRRSFSLITPPLRLRKQGLNQLPLLISFDHLAWGAFKPVIDRRFRFTEIDEPHRYMESNAQVGKIVLSL